MIRIARPGVDVVSAWFGAIPSSHNGSGGDPTLNTDIGVDGAIRDIARTVAPLSKVIVYGYSLGGTDALDLSRRLAGTKIRVLITIDAAVPFSSDAVDRKVGPSSIRNLNIFQTHKHGITGSRGGSNTGTGVINIDRTPFYKGRENDGHILIHNDTISDALQEIRREFFTP